MVSQFSAFIVKLRITCIAMFSELCFTMRNESLAVKGKHEGSHGLLNTLSSPWGSSHKDGLCASADSSQLKFIILFFQIYHKHGLYGAETGHLAAEKFVDWYFATEFSPLEFLHLGIFDARKIRSLIIRCGIYSMQEKFALLVPVHRLSWFNHS